MTTNAPLHVVLPVFLVALTFWFTCGGGDAPPRARRSESGPQNSAFLGDAPFTLNVYRPAKKGADRTNHHGPSGDGWVGVALGVEPLDVPVRPGCNLYPNPGNLREGEVGIKSL